MTENDTQEKSVPVRQHVAYLDGLRALAALFVVLHHAFLQVNFEGVHLSRGMSAVTYVLGFGHYAVDVFIVLSGFCLALPVVYGDGHLRGGAVSFFRKRARRILPSYFLALGFSLLLIWLAIGHKTGTIWDTSLPVTPKAVLTHLFLIQDVFRDTTWKINHALWSVAVEWRIYFFFPLLLALRRRCGAFQMTAAAAIFSYAALIIGQHTSLNSVVDLDKCGVTPQYFGLFAIGILGADIAHGKSRQMTRFRRSVPASALLGATTLILFAARIRLHSETLPLAEADFFVGLWAAALMVTAASAEIAWLNKALSWRPLVFIGTFAYSLYLIHAPMLQVIWQYLLFPLHSNPTEMFLGLCFLGTPLIVAAAYLFFLVCERPFLTTHKRETLAETEREAALSPAP